MEALGSLLEGVLPIKIILERFAVGHLFQLEWHHARVCAHHFIATAAAVAALDLFHLRDFLLGLCLRNYFVQVLVGIVQDHDRGALLPIIHHLHLLLEDFVLFLFVEDLVLLAYLLHNVEVEKLLGACR